MSFNQIPTQSKFYATGVVPVAKSPTSFKCTICCEGWQPSANIVYVKPCKHVFHYTCIMNWFHKQLHRRDGSRAPLFNGTCPNCRYDLFTVNGLSEREMRANEWVRKLPRLRSTKFDAIGLEAEDRIQREGRVTPEVVIWVAQEMARIEPDVGNRICVVGALPNLPAPRPVQRLALQPYGIDVNTDTDYALVNQTLRGDVEVLFTIVSEAFVYERNRTWETGQTLQYIPCIDLILRKWHDYGYPRTNYITLPSLQRLTVCAALITDIGRRDPFNHMASFAQLVTHGDTLLLEAQREALSTTVLGIEYRRLLNRPDDFATQGYQLDHYSGNRLRVEWIVWLRLRVRGRGADPLGPRPYGSRSVSRSGYY